MNDKEIMCNYLSLLKSNTEVYVHGTIESANENVRNLLHTGLNFTLDHQACTYDTMVENSMYEVDNVKISDIKKVYDKLNKEM